jgi:hypothetical protein
MPAFKLFLFKLWVQYRAYAPQPNCRFNSDTNTGHGFAIFMASVGALSTFGAPAPLN